MNIEPPPGRCAAPPCRHDGGGGGKRASPRKISYSLPAKCDNCYFPLQYLKQENATSMSFSAQSLWSLKAKMKVGHSTHWSSSIRPNDALVCSKEPNALYKRCPALMFVCFGHLQRRMRNISLWDVCRTWLVGTRTLVYISMAKRRFSL